MAVTRKTTGAGDVPSLLAYDRDHVNDLYTRIGGLAPLANLADQETTRKIMRGGIVAVDVPEAVWFDTARAIRDDLGFEILTSISGADMLDHLESVYHLRSVSNNWLLQVRVRVPNDAPYVDSVVAIYPSANWLERETYDMYGIVYRGHPDLRRILLDDEFEGFPLLKSFRSTPMTLHDRATTQTNAVEAVSGAQVRGQERIVVKRLGQGAQERVHPGIATMGSEAVFLQTGQGVGTDDNAMHGYVVDEQYLPPDVKPDEEE